MMKPLVAISGVGSVKNERTNFGWQNMVWVIVGKTLLGASAAYADIKIKTINYVIELLLEG